MIDYRYKYLLEIYRTLNITKASEILHVQQAGLSKVLKKIEEEIGSTLFLRTKKGLIATPFCEKIIREIQSLELEWNDRINTLKKNNTEISGKFKLGCHQAIAANHLKQKLPKLITQFPKLEVELKFAPSSVVTQKVISGEIDLGIVASAINHPDLVLKKIYSENVSAWANGTPADDSPLYYNPDMISIHEIIKKFKNRKLIAVPDYFVILSYLNNNKNHIGILPQGVTTASPSLKMVGTPFYTTQIALIYRYDYPKTNAFKTLCSHLLNDLEQRPPNLDNLLLKELV